MDISPDEDEKGFEFGPSAPSGKQNSLDLKPVTPIPEQISDGELEKEIVEELTAAAQPKISVKVSKVAKVIESTTATLAKTASKAKESRKRRRSPKPRSASPNTDEEIKIKARTSSGRPPTTLRRASPHRSRGRGREDRPYSDIKRNLLRGEIFNFKQPKQINEGSAVQDLCLDDGIQGQEVVVVLVTGLVVGQNHVAGAEIEVMGVTSQGRVAHVPEPCRRAEVLVEVGIVLEAVVVVVVAAPEVIEVVVEAVLPNGGSVANETPGIELGISLGSLDPQLQGQPKSVDDFVSYCQQIQRRQDKESRREKGEAVSSEGSDADGLPESTAEGTSTFKHPFGVRTAASDGIKINIVNATSIPTKTPQERVLDTSQLRLVYPVSSGVTHKEKTDTWTPVVKDELKTCSDEQKKYVAVTSLEAERYRSTSVSPVLFEFFIMLSCLI
ncbi:unnamed protein product [Nippostrongylus brasiliensis]|uniref:Protein SON (inferred by orthology to a human protein) n=1 Tax=Nippostrongylus brasiliensis TaxID=27835 RepID=A0A0N4XKQ2_NIPBR|nr:unnamed protein product [Nippostrongylus brasiliensis]